MTERPHDADLVITGARVYGADAQFGADTLVSRNGTIHAIGRWAEVADQVPGSAQVLRFDGGLVVPGFQDAHIHAVQTGLRHIQCELEDATSAEDCVGRVRAYCVTHPDAPWIQGGGWPMGHFGRGCPAADLLDGIGGGRPIFLVSRDGHSGWANRTALELCGVTARTADPADGRIERLPGGTPQGTLHEGAMGLVRDHAPEASDEEYFESLLWAQGYLHSLGITAWQDARADDGFVRAYRRADQSGLLTARVVGAQWWDRGSGTEQLDHMVSTWREQSTDRLDLGSVKIMQDGVVENSTAAMTFPYFDQHGQETTNDGLSFLDPAELAEAVRVIDKAGMQVHVHAVGDRAVREALDAFAGLPRREPGQRRRHHIAHIEVIHPDDVPRFRGLDVTANMQPFWAGEDEEMRTLRAPVLGVSRVTWQYPFAALYASGARLAGGSDWGVSTPDPLLGIEVAVNRVLPESRGAPTFLPAERLPLEVAIDAYTQGSAYVNRLDDRTGRLQPGLLADLAVLSHDPFEPGRDLGDVRVDATTVDGRLVHLTDGAG